MVNDQDGMGAGHHVPSLAVKARISPPPPPLTLNVYAGPAYCDSTQRVQDGDYVSVYFDIFNDQSSSTGVPGKLLYSSRDGSGKPKSFHLGEHKVISAFDHGLVGMCKGAKATVLVPPDEGFGANGAGSIIPSNATLLLNVELIDRAPSSLGHEVKRRCLMTCEVTG